MEINTFSNGESFTPRNIDRAGKLFVANGDFIADVQKYRAIRLACLNTTLGILMRARLPERAYIGIRLKRLDSIRRKLMRETANFRLSALDDIIGVRIICASLEDTLQVSKSIESLPESTGKKDYIQNEHYVNTGYRGIHHIMRFEQSISPDEKIKVRFEIQVRSYYQHLWAVWSESFGENIKQGGGADHTGKVKEIIGGLKSSSAYIAEWEGKNPAKRQDSDTLPVYSRKCVLAVAWRQPGGNDVMLRIFKNGAKETVKYLNYLEQKFPHDRGNALLLAGIPDRKDIRKDITKVLMATHPMYVLGRAYPPKYWMPRE